MVWSWTRSIHNRIEIMIGEPDARKQGLAQEALELMMAYAIATLGIERFYGKIHATNTPSMNLFQK